MIDVIPNIIQSDEVLVHFLSNKSFKNKILEESKLEDKNVFLPNKGGVSMQRSKYCGEQECKSRAVKIMNNGRFFVGFISFLHSSFLGVKDEYKKSRANFDAKIIHTPLCERDEVITERPVYINQTGNPSHADLVYINPAATNDESPSTAIRSFSRKLAKVCTVHLDRNISGLEYEGKLFH